jgi:methylenetetrahydrofolate dehydrogenase (NADP+) / methenyltetrahydrofolate cyclohydrolase
MLASTCCHDVRAGLRPLTRNCLLWSCLCRIRLASSHTCVDQQNFTPGYNALLGQARLLNGRQHAQLWRTEIAWHVACMTERARTPPGLAVVVVGNRPDSCLYIRHKGEACKEIGMHFHLEHLPRDVKEDIVIGVIHKLNRNARIHGILLQLPLPIHLNTNRLLLSIDPMKDVDGIHPDNVGRLALRGIQRPSFLPCAPLGCLELLWREKIRVLGRSVAIIGDSNVVGMPMAWAFRDAGASSVTLLHSRGLETMVGLTTHERQGFRHRSGALEFGGLLTMVQVADIVIAAFGKARVVRGEWIKPGATVVDIGINTIPSSTDTSKMNFDHGCIRKVDMEDESNLFRMGDFHVVGDVDAEDVSSVAGAMSPVPGGAGPMTIAALLSNTYLGASRQNQGDKKCFLTDRDEYLRR